MRLQYIPGVLQCHLDSGNAAGACVGPLKRPELGTPMGWHDMVHTIPKVMEGHVREGGANAAALGLATYVHTYQNTH